ncbi:MAG: AmmeMemoRadiSam system protein B [Mariprofundaceae bacterium]
MSVRPAAVAGQFYPQDTDELRAMIRALLADCHVDIHQPKALIAPHAGYIYSGLTAAHAYATLNGARIKRVVLLGPAHRVPFYGLSLPDADAFATPLGQVPLDQQLMEKALALPDVSVNAQAHAMEHSLEVQIPFLQEVLDDFTLVPLCVGAVDIGSVAAVINHLWGGDETLIVISSDLSHFHPYAEARDIDQHSLTRMLAMQPELNHEQACGATPVNGLLLAAASHPLTPHLLDYRNSGDTAGDKQSVVGYPAIAFCATQQENVYE